MEMGIHNFSLILLIVALVILSGCGKSTNETTYTATPAPVPETQTQRSVVEKSRLINQIRSNPEMIVFNHSNKLLSTSYTGLEKTIVRQNGTVIHKSILKVQVESDASRYHYLIVSRSVDSYPIKAPAHKIELWYNGEKTLSRISGSNGSSEYFINPNPSTGGPLSDPTNFNQIYRSLYSFQPNLSGQHMNNGTHYFRLVSSNLTRPYHDPNIPGFAQNGSLSMLVTKKGIIRQYKIKYKVRISNSTAWVHQTLEFSAIGNTTVEKPSWYYIPVTSE